MKPRRLRLQIHDSKLAFVNVDWSSGVLPQKRRVDAPVSQASLGLLERPARLHREGVEAVLGVGGLRMTEGAMESLVEEHRSKWPHSATTLSTRGQRDSKTGRGMLRSHTYVWEEPAGRGGDGAVVGESWPEESPYREELALLRESGSLHLAGTMVRRAMLKKTTGRRLLKSTDLQAWTSVKLQEWYHEEDDERKTIVQQILQKSTDILTRIIAPVGGQGGWHCRTCDPSVPLFPD